MDWDFVDGGTDIEHVDVTEYFGDVLMGVFEIFLDVLLVDSLLQHALVLGVHGVFRQLLEFFLLLVELLHALAVLLPHEFSQTLDIVIENKIGYLWLLISKCGKSLWVVFYLKVDLLR